MTTSFAEAVEKGELPARETVIRALNWLEKRHRDSYELLHTGDQTYRKVLQHENVDQLIELMLELERVMHSRDQWVDIFRFFYRFGPVGAVVCLISCVVGIEVTPITSAFFGLGSIACVAVAIHSYKHYKIAAVLRLGVRALHTLVSHAAEVHFIKRIQAGEIDGTA